MESLTYAGKGGVSRDSYTLARRRQPSMFHSAPPWQGQMFRRTLNPNVAKNNPITHLALDLNKAGSFVFSYRRASRPGLLSSNPTSHVSRAIHKFSSTRLASS